MSSYNQGLFLSFAKTNVLRVTHLQRSPPASDSVLQAASTLYMPPGIQDPMSPQWGERGLDDHPGHCWVPPGMGYHFYLHHIDHISASWPQSNCEGG